MNAKGRFISFLLVVNAFFGGYAAGLNGRYVAVVDPKLPPLKSEPAVANADKPLKENSSKGRGGKKSSEQKESSPSKGKSSHKNHKEKDSAKKDSAKKHESSGSKGKSGAKDKKHSGT